MHKANPPAKVRCSFTASDLLPKNLSHNLAVRHQRRTRVDPMDSSDSCDPVEAPTVTRLTGSEAVKLHLTLAGGFALCIAGFYFEFTRALGGNSLSWAYVFEWPLFAVFAVYMSVSYTHLRAHETDSYLVC